MELRWSACDDMLSGLTLPEGVRFEQLARESRARQISSPMGAVEPTRRGLGVGTLKGMRQQKNAERHGFRLCGLLPAIDRDAIAPGVIRRVYEGIYVKVLAAESEVHVPDWDDLGEHARAPWVTIFGEHPGAGR
jgi:hypothetical protein